MSSLITIVRNKFLEAIRSVNPPGRWKILVVDEHSQKLLGTVLKQFDILEENVTQIESISNYREPQGGFEALYLIMPTTQNVDRILKDWNNQQYAGAHLFFVDGLPETLFQRIMPAESWLRCLKELFINFRASEAQTFTFDMPEQVFTLYSPPRSEREYPEAKGRLNEDLQFTSKLIANVCITLNEFPFIRYYLPTHHAPLGPLKPHATTRPPPPTEGSGRWRTNLARGGEARAYESVEGDFVTKLLSFMVQSQLEEHKKANPDFGKPDARGRSTLIITDRSMDMMAPFLHEFTYQAMAHDLLPIQDGTKYTYKFQSSMGEYEDKTATLSDNDSVWTDVRHMHMREAIDKLMADFNKFIEEHAVFNGDGAANLNDMKDMLASLPQYQEQRENFSLHLSMAQECMDRFERDKLPLVANVEQNCATGLTAEGKAPKHLVEEMVPLLDSKDVVNMNKVRMIALYIQFRDGVPDEDRRRLYQHARLSLAEQDAVNAMLEFGVRIGRGSGDKDIKKKLKPKSTDDDYELSRYKPLIRTVIEDHVAGKLDNTLFPYVKDSPSTAAPAASVRAAPAQATSLRSQKPAWHRAARPGAASESKQRLLVFMAGGMTYSEVREAYQLSSSLNKEIYIGSSHTITPRNFIDDLKVVTLAGVGSRVTPNGLREFRGNRPLQDFYDERYFTKDGPRPQPRAAAPPSSKGSSSLPKAPRIEQTESYSSTNSMSSSIREEKKKKKGLFGRF
ncbi:syntaxin binding protein 1 [Marasmius sp. AFHP31]|nr:syntaxin binding protein 1 [Marasmius sp. AFHP31]